MATDGPDPIPCNTDIYEMGTEIMVADLSSNRMEKFVTHIRKESGEKVDWHYDGARAVVLVVGDIAKVKECIIANLPLFAELRKEYIAQNGWENIQESNKGYYFL